jgi:nitrate reductase gamma subunit
MEQLFYGILPLAAGTLFFSASVLRIAAWLRRPVPYQLTLFPVPAEGSKKLALAAHELFLFRTLFRENRLLWLLAWLFHLSLAMILVGHVLGISSLRSQFTVLGASLETSALISRTLGGVAGAVMVSSLVALFCRRLLDRELRRLSEPLVWFDLLLLLSIASSGLGMYLPGFHPDLPAVRSWIASLFRFDPVPFPSNPLLTIHLWLAGFLLIYVPFSQLMHAAGALVNRAMLMEAPPTFPTPVGKRRRSPFAGKRENREGSQR